jgi:3-hydroxybutyrate dehydrogenase
VVSIAADLSQRAAIEAMMADLLGRVGAVDILVNNAVARHFSPVENFPPERWDEALAVNLSAPFHLIRLALPGMKRTEMGPHHQHGVDLFDSRGRGPHRLRDHQNGHRRHDPSGRNRERQRADYLQRTVPGHAADAGHSGEESQGSRPAKGRSIDETTSDYLASRQPTRRFVALEAIGAMAVFLCSPAAQDITGATLPIDGGWSIA